MTQRGRVEVTVNAPALLLAIVAVVFAWWIQQRYDAANDGWMGLLLWAMWVLGRLYQKVPR